MTLRRKYRSFGLHDTGSRKKWTSLATFFNEIDQDNGCANVEELQLATIVTRACKEIEMRGIDGVIRPQGPTRQLTEKLCILFSKTGVVVETLRPRAHLEPMFRQTNSMQAFHTLLLPMFTNLRIITLPDIDWDFEFRTDLANFLHFVAKQQPQTLCPVLQTIKWHKTSKVTVPTLIPLIAIRSVRNLIVFDLTRVLLKASREIDWPHTANRWGSGRRQWESTKEIFENVKVGSAQAKAWDFPPMPPSPAPLPPMPKYLPPGHWPEDDC